MTPDRVLRIAYWVVTVLMCAIFSMSAFMYFTDYDMVKMFFEMLGYPTYLIYPLATAKVLGVVAVLTRLSPMLKEWAYAGFAFDAALAAAAHLAIDDGSHATAVLALVLIAGSKVLEHFAYPKKKSQQG